MAKLTLQLFGPPHVHGIDKTSRIKLRKAVALAAFLAVERRAFSREYLATMLWPHHTHEKALANLRRNLSHLRSIFGEGCIVTDGDQVAVDLASIQIDVHEFQEYADVRLDGADTGKLEAAAAIQQGSFLEGFTLGNCLEFDEWQDRIRDHYHTELDGVLEVLTRRLSESGDYYKAVEYSRRWLQLDDLNEAAHRRLIAVFSGMGRADLARHQFETCVRLLAKEGLEPDGATLELFELLKEEGPHMAAETGSATAATGAQSGSRDRGLHGIRHRLAFVAAIVLLTGPTLGTVISLGYFHDLELAVVSVAAFESNGRLSEVRTTLGNAGRAIRDVDYSVVLFGNEIIGTDTEFVVYSDTVSFGRSDERVVSVRGPTGIQNHVDSHDVRIPPGYYRVKVTIDPANRIREFSEENSKASIDSVFFPGAALVETFVVEIEYGASAPLDASNPLRVYIGDRGEYHNSEGWEHFEVSEGGTYYFPVDSVPVPDYDESGYFLMLIYDPNNDLANPFDLGPDDIGALYKEVPSNLVYGALNLAGGSPLYPGGEYSVRFLPPPPPPADPFEPDDTQKLGTPIDLSSLPVRQYHTFHYDGDETADDDWFRIFLERGEEIVVETRSADGSWESDTVIDIADAQMNYITSSTDRWPTTGYSTLRYANTTGVDQLFYVLVRRYDRGDPRLFQPGEYIVEFRR